MGLATAYRLTERFPGARVCVLEKEAGVGRHQTGHNSGVLHCGLYYKPKSVKARLAVTGIRQMVEFCRENAIPHEICGKLVVAVADAEVARLRALHERGVANGLAGLRSMTRDEMLEIEPHVGGVAALRGLGKASWTTPKSARHWLPGPPRAAPAWSPARTSNGSVARAPVGWPLPRRASSKPIS